MRTVSATLMDAVALCAAAAPERKEECIEVVQKVDPYIPPRGSFTTGVVLLRPLGQMLADKPCTGRHQWIHVGALVPIHSGAAWWPLSAAPRSWHAAMRRATPAARQQRCQLIAIARIGACIERGTAAARSSPWRKWHLQTFRYHWIFDAVHMLDTPLMTLDYQPRTVCGQRFTVRSKLSRAIERDLTRQRARASALARARAR